MCGREHLVATNIKTRIGSGGRAADGGARRLPLLLPSLHQANIFFAIFFRLISIFLDLYLGFP